MRINLKLIIYLNITCKIIKFQEENLGLESFSMWHSLKEWFSKEKDDKFYFIKMRKYYFMKDTLKRIKTQSITRKKHSQIMYLTKSLFPEYTKNSQN